jgi:hypothetical protein
MQLPKIIADLLAAQDKYETVAKSTYSIFEIIK